MRDGVRDCARLEGDNGLGGGGRNARRSGELVRQFFTPCGEVVHGAWWAGCELAGDEALDDELQRGQSRDDILFHFQAPVVALNTSTVTATVGVVTPPLPGSPGGVRHV